MDENKELLAFYEKLFTNEELEVINMVLSSENNESAKVLEQYLYRENEKND